MSQFESSTIKDFSSMAQSSKTASLTSSSPRPNKGRELSLLVLDGGGVRGLASLVILKQLMESIKPENPPKPCEYFDMIGGTSTGGLIALMLGRLHMTIDECIVEYKALSPKIFVRANDHIDILNGETRARFNHRALENAVEDMLSRKNLPRDELLKETSDSGCKAFVCATSKHTSNTVVLSSYYSKRRGTELWNIAKIWQAARATFAASSFFDPIEIGGEGFIDGSSGANNPIQELWTEATDMWRDGSDWKLEDNISCLVSIGTGIPILISFGDDPDVIGHALLAMALDTEQIADTFHKHHTNLFRERRAFRFNVVKGLEFVGLEDASKMGQIAAVTRRYIQSEEVFTKIEECTQKLRERECSSVYA